MKSDGTPAYDTCDTGKKSGRPRCEATHQAILEATMRLMETQSLRDLTVEGIAREAKVGKPTIYRWWDTKCVLAMDAFFAAAAPRVPPAGSGPAAEAMAEQVRALVRMLASPVGRFVAEMIGEGQSQKEVMTRFRERFFTQLLAPSRQVIERGKASGQVDTVLDTELAIDMIYGPVYYRLLIRNQPLDEAFADALAARLPAILAPAPNAPR